MMKKAALTLSLGIILTSFLVCLSGCQCGSPECCIPGVDQKRCTQPGETACEGNRRNIRNARINHEEMNQDIADFWIYRNPSTLTDKRIP
jgi:hypothetical protein